MTFVAPRLVLVTPVVSDVQAFRPALTDAFADGKIASLILRLGRMDERSLINAIKMLAPIAQAQDAAVTVEVVGARELGHDAAQIAIRGGADGIHVNDLDELRILRERYRDSHIIGAGRLGTKHDAMQAGEFGADYVLFGEPDETGVALQLEALIERAHWWAEIFETPCVALVPSLSALPEIAETGAEFIGLSEAVWAHAGSERAAVEAALEALEALEDTFS